MRKVIVIGYPSHVGGADTELWHTVKLWRRFGVQVQLMPTWKASKEWRERLNAIGATTVQVDSIEAVTDHVDLNDAILVSFCNGQFLEKAGYFRNAGCKVVWVNCMTWVFEEELKHYEEYGLFDAYVFQSSYQMSCIQSRLAPLGIDNSHCFQIRGAFDVQDFPFEPLTHRRNEPFVLGRIARPDLDKWSSNFWPIYRAVQYANKRAHVMAWSELLTQKCGPPPDWARTFSANEVSAQEFLRSIHCMLPVNGGAKENWPRSGLEAMSTGVPIVAQNDWGWREMIEHGVTGFLGSDDCELAHFAALLAHDEELRMQIALNARKRLVECFASPTVIMSAWEKLFASLDSVSTPAEEALNEA